MSIIADNLEERCRRIVRKIKKHPFEPTPVTFIGREMALNLDHMDAVNGPSEFRRERICTTVAGWKAFGRARNAVRSGLIFDNFDERDARNGLRADR